MNDFIKKLVGDAISCCYSKKRELTPTWVMYEAMNITTDSDLQNEMTDIVEIADAIQDYFDKKCNVSQGK